MSEPALRNVPDVDAWLKANQRYLQIALDGVREALEHHVRAEGESPPPRPDLKELAGHMVTPPALETLTQTFHLSTFERNVLLLCAGMELDSRFQKLSGPPPARQAATFRMALAAFDQPHWSALAPDAPLRRWRLIELETDGGVTEGRLRIDERIVNYLIGVQHLDARLQGYVERLTPQWPLVPSHQQLARRIAATWHRAQGKMPVLQLVGPRAAEQWDIASAACELLGINLHVLHAQALPADPQELAALIRLWEREARLSVSALLLDCHPVVTVSTARDTTGDSARANALATFIDAVDTALMVASRERIAPRLRPLFTLETAFPTEEEQHGQWRDVLGHRAEALTPIIGALVSQFRLGRSTIEAIIASTDLDVKHPCQTLWEACRIQARAHIEDLAQRIEPMARWCDLILPARQEEILHEIAIHLRHRKLVYDDWEFAQKSNRGLGIAALFCGSSGTGKTMAAEVLANDLELDLYRIDLSQVVSKYIGETEKNLRRLFDAAEESGAILLFDEADALFGRRSEVRDSHDRYANIEISYLLQRMENYRGLAILTTNMQNALDLAFLRRLRFIVPFPFPDAAQRVEIWRRVFPGALPLGELDFTKLARLNITGGNIRNIALYAAFLAAEEHTALNMAHLQRAARVEFAKMEKPLNEADLKDWV